MNSLIDFSSRFRILKGGKISLVVSAFLGGAIIANAAPSGGVVTSGNATINQSGNVTNINQSSQKASINWNDFSIKSNETVNFNQPNVNSITLNRVVGTEKSVIDGALNANGQVWILNSNGVLFNKNAKVNTSGLVATTAQLSDADFQAGNYEFKNSSSNSVINVGTIEVQNGGSVVLASNEVQNSGTIKAVRGKVHLVGADSYSLNLNGNSLVNLKVNKGVLDALVKNSGNIIANGGEIYLTTNAVNELLKGVVNNTGIIEANSIDGITGKVELFAHGGEVQVGGTIEVKDGFVETSGKDFKVIEGATVKAKNWLIDPVDITIDSTLANTISTALGSGNVTITTDGNNTPSTVTGESDSVGDIFITSNINYTGTNESTLTLKAARNILFGNDYTTPTSFGSISSSTAALNVLLWSDSDGNSNGSVWLPEGSSISTHGGDVWIGGGSTSATWNGLTVGNSYAVGSTLGSAENNSIARGVAINGNINAGGGDIFIKGKATVASNYGAARGVSIVGDISTTGNGNITIEGIAKGSSDAIVIGDTSIAVTDGDGSITIENGTINIFGQANLNNSSSDSFYLNNGSFIKSTGVGTLIISGNNGNILSDLTSYIDVSNLLLLNAKQIDLQSTSNDVNTFVTSNISDAINVYDKDDLTIGSIVYNGTTYSGLSINANNTIQSATSITLDSDIAWSSNSKLALTSPTINVKSIINNTNSTDGGIYFNASNNYSAVIFDSDAKVIINNINQLQWINTALKGNYELGSNIDASATSTWNSNGSDGYYGWNPIGYQTDYSDRAHAFTGNFDGLGHTISNLYINRSSTDNMGLFGYVDSSSISNVGILNVDITGNGGVGALVGYLYKTTSLENVYSTGIVKGNYGVGGIIGATEYVNNVSSIKNSYSTATVQGTENVGGLIGNAYGINVENSYSTGNISSTNLGYENSIGGLIGYAGNNILIKNSYATGNIIGYAYGYVGGLVGYNYDGIIENSYATGSVTGTSNVGGLVGLNWNTINNSYATGNVTGTNYVGGLTGYNKSTISNSYATGNITGTTNVGGLAGSSLNTIRDSYATGDVTGTSNIGGLLGQNQYAEIDNAYSIGKVTGTGANVRGLIGENLDPETIIAYYDKTVNTGMADESSYGKTSDELKTLTIFSGWDIQTDSSIDKGTPFLAWQRNGNSYTKVWVIGTKVVSTGGNTSNSGSSSTSTTNDINKVVTAIVNTSVLQTPKINVLLPQPIMMTTPTTAFNGERVNLVSRPMENQPTTLVSMSDLRANQNSNNPNGNSDIRVPVGDNSIIQLVNGGVLLPFGVDQQFFVVNNENNNI